MRKLNYHDAAYEVIISSSADAEYKDFLTRNQMSKNPRVREVCAYLYANIERNFCYLSKGNFLGTPVSNKMKYIIEESNVYFTYNIVSDGTKNVVIIYDIFFPIPLKGIYSILKESYKVIKINQTQLRKLIQESIKKVLNIT